MHRSPLLRNRRTPRPRCGFTIVEVLVVSGVIAILLAVLVPALSSAKSTARKASELSSARQLMTGYAAYAMANRDAVLPGYLDSPRASDGRHSSFTGGQLAVAARRYVWRIAPYLNHDVRSLYPNDMAEVLDRLQYQEYDDYLYAASVSPALGLNSEWLGGDLNAYGFLPANHPLRSTLDLNRFYLTSISQARVPSRLLVFASARGVDPQNPATGGSNDVIQGYFKITSPFFTELTEGRWNDEPYSSNSSPEAFGHVSPRYRNTSVTAFIDGHVGSLSIEELRDMRHWANWAKSPDWRLPRLP